MSGQQSGRKARAALSDLRALEEQGAAANPIAPSLNRKSIKGGAAVRERATVRKMADQRALEEQALAAIPGTGATPSTGLSRRRGGKSKIPSLKVAEKRMKPSLHNAMEDEMALMPSGEYDGAGKHTLMDHLSAPMKGFGDYLHAFEGGLRTGRYEGEGATPSVGLSQFRGGMAMGQVVGSGKLTITHGDESESDEEMEGGAPRLMMCDEPAAAAAAAPAGKKKRAPAGPDDGRRKRAAVVKKVMADRGLSMIEASKYVKEHGLYPGAAAKGATVAVRMPPGARRALARPPPGSPTAEQSAASRRRAEVRAIKQYGRPRALEELADE
jgi:hypothetical protein